VLVNTHSSVFVVDDDKCQKIFKVEKCGGITNIDEVSGGDKMSVVYELLGGNPADLLLPRNFFIVEGKSDEQFLINLIKRFYIDKPPIQIVYAEGNLAKQCKSMEAINKIYIPIGVTSSIYRDRLVILIDKPCIDKEKDKLKFLSDNSNLTSKNQFYELPVDALEKYYPKTWKKDDSGVKELDKQKNGKLLYAREVATVITKEEFEKEMTVVYEALVKCWKEAY